MHERTRYVVNGHNCTSLAATAEEFTRALKLTMPWRGNFDAFNDILNGGFGTPDDGFELVWERSDAARVGLGYRETIKWLEERSTHAHPSNRDDFLERLAAAKSGAGPTLFDTLTEIIRDHEDIELRLV